MHTRCAQPLGRFVIVCGLLPFDLAVPKLLPWPRFRSPCRTHKSLPFPFSQKRRRAVRPPLAQHILRRRIDVSKGYEH